MRLLEKLYKLSIERIYKIRETKYIQEDEKGKSEFIEVDKKELKAKKNIEWEDSWIERIPSLRDACKLKSIEIIRHNPTKLRYIEGVVEENKKILLILRSPEAVSEFQNYFNKEKE